MNWTISKARKGILALSACGALMLGGCVSLGAEPPESLLTLSSTASAPAGSGSGRVTSAEGSAGAIAVLTPEVPAKLNVLRVPVQISDTEIAYLQNAFWVEKPARLFRRLIGETLRTRTDALVLDTDDTPTLAGQFVRGTLLDMGFDAPTSSVVVRFDAIRSDEDGTVTSRRFEARESGVLAEPGSVGPALNRAANEVAGEVANWILSGQ
jgi:cholesterol transport system auxiliary component